MLQNEEGKRRRWRPVAARVKQLSARRFAFSPIVTSRRPNAANHHPL